MFTPIHRELGLSGSEVLNWDLMQRVVGEHIHEQRDLDFKMVAYNSQDPAVVDELAKDLCAMANSGGGWIICGIRADKKKDIAVELTPFDIDKNTAQNIHRVARTHVQPALMDIRIHTIESPEGKWLFAIEIPPSDFIPHLCLYKKRNDSYPFYAPVRNGPSTIGLTEPEIRRLYREAMSLSKTRIDKEDELFDEFAQYGDIYGGLTFIMTAFPDVQTENRLNEFDVVSEFNRLHVTAWTRKNNGVWLLDHAGGKTTRGYRSWVIRHEYDEHQQRYWRVEISDRGVIRVAIRLGGWQLGDDSYGYYPVGKPNQAPQGHIEDALIEAFALVVKSQRQWYARNYKIVVGLSGLDKHPIVIRRMDPSLVNRLQPEDTNKVIHKFHRVHGFLEKDAAEDEQLSVLYKLAEDIVNQGEIMYPYNVKSPE